MSFPSQVRTRIAALFMLALSALCGDDPIFIQRTAQWTPQGLMVSAWRQPLEFTDRKKTRPLAHPEFPVAFEVPPASKAQLGSKAFWLQGRIYLTGSGKGTSTLWCFDQGRWSKEATLAYGGYWEPTLLPLDNGRYLVFMPPMEDDCKREWNAPRRHYFGIARRNERGELSMTDYGDLGIKNADKDPHIRRAFVFADASVVTDDLLTLGCPEYGVFWTFSLKNGALKRSMALYEPPLEQMMQKGMGTLMLLNMQPLKEGNILVSARDGAFQGALATETAKLKQLMQPPPGTNIDPKQARDRFRFQQQAIQDIYIQYPHVHWFELDPDKGSVRRRNPSPVGARDLIHTVLEVRNFYWLPDEDGRVHFLDRYLKGLETAPYLPKAPGSR